jgi:alpha-ribazole phosphatase
MITLTLVRHGQTAWNATGRFMGQTDVPLDETGLRQAQAVARRLDNTRPDAIYASDLKRAKQTAEAIQAAIAEAIHPASPPEIIPEPRLRELYFGEWQGLVYDQIQTRYPAALAAWEADMLNCAPAGGETLIQLAGRVQEAYAEIIAAHPEGTVLLVAHGGALQALLCLALGVPIERYWQLELKNTSICELHVYPAGAILHMFNDTCHLEETG